MARLRMHIMARSGRELPPEVMLATGLGHPGLQLSVLVPCLSQHPSAFHLGFFQNGEMFPLCNLTLKPIPYLQSFPQNLTLFQGFDVFVFKERMT